MVELIMIMMMRCGALKGVLEVSQTEMCENWSGLCGHDLIHYYENNEESVPCPIASIGGG